MLAALDVEFTLVHVWASIKLCSEYLLGVIRSRQLELPAEVEPKSVEGSVNLLIVDASFPHMFYGVEIGRSRWPRQNVDASIFQELHSSVGNVRTNSVLLKKDILKILYPRRKSRVGGRGQCLPG